MAISFLRSANGVTVTVDSVKNIHTDLQKVQISYKVSNLTFNVTIGDIVYRFLIGSIGTINNVAAPATPDEVLDALASGIFSTELSTVNKFRLLSAATTNATSVKTTGGRIKGWYIYNNTASVKVVKLYNKATSPTVGTDTPFLTIPVAANSDAAFTSNNGISFSTGIALAVTAGIADADVAAVAANDITLNLFYI